MLADRDKDETWGFLGALEDSTRADGTGRDGMGKGEGGRTSVSTSPDFCNIVCRAMKIKTGLAVDQLARDIAPMCKILLETLGATESASSAVEDAANVAYMFIDELRVILVEDAKSGYLLVVVNGHDDKVKTADQGRFFPRQSSGSSSWKDQAVSYFMGRFLLLSLSSAGLSVGIQGLECICRARASPFSQSAPPSFREEFRCQLPRVVNVMMTKRSPCCNRREWSMVLHTSSLATKRPARIIMRFGVCVCMSLSLAPFLFFSLG